MKQRKRPSSIRKRISCKKSSHIKTLQILNNLEWNILDRPDEANFDINILDIPWCRGHIKLMLPIVKSSSTGDNSMNVYYHQDIKKENITIGHILATIYNFYNFDRVIQADIAFVSEIPTMKDFANMILRNYYIDKTTIKNLKFKDFLQGQTQFSGLKHQYLNIYTLNLV